MSKETEQSKAYYQKEASQLIQSIEDLKREKSKYKGFGKEKKQKRKEIQERINSRINEFQYLREKCPYWWQKISLYFKEPNSD